MSKKIVNVLGVRLDCVKRMHVFSDLLDVLKVKKSVYLTTPNPEILLESRRNEDFRNVLNESYLNLTDGMGLIWASYFVEVTKNNGRFIVFLKWIWTLLLLAFYKRKLYGIIPERIIGVDFMNDFCEVCAVNKLSVFLLGAADGVAEQTADILRNRFDGLNVVGTFVGTPSVEDELDLCTRINDSCAEVLFVAYGAPRQEMWIARNLDKLTSVNVAIGIGGSFDFISGNVRRAPKLMRKFGLEWLFRLFVQPSRFKRIFNALIVFPCVVLKDRLR